MILASILVSAFVVFIELPLHEYAHAVTAYKCGDDTPKLAGGLTLNPIAHIDLMGAILIVLTGFGWAKPTPVNPYNYKNPRRDNILVSLAGPVSNLLLGWLFCFLTVAVTHMGSFPATNGGVLVTDILYIAGQISVFLAVVNLLPIPMFDGFAVLESFLPQKAVYWIQTHQGMLSMIILLLFLTGAFSIPLMWLSGWFLKFFLSLAELTFTGIWAMPAGLQSIVLFL